MEKDYKLNLKEKTTMIRITTDDIERLNKLTKKLNFKTRTKTIKHIIDKYEENKNE